jgi:putative oxidoreductase
MKLRLKPLPDFGLLAIRIVLGLSYMIVHGGPKLIAGPQLWTKVGSAVSYLGINFSFTAWGFLAACAESFGGLLLLLGLCFRPASVFIFITMFVAANSVLAGGSNLATIAHPVELGITALGLFFTGPGKYSLDYQLFGRKKL